MASFPTLELRGIDKSFGPVHALTSVDLTADAGEVTALVGDNGAGKTTLIKCVGGIHRVDAGEFLFDGVPRSIHGPRDAARLGVEIVYQDLALSDTSTASTTWSSAVMNSPGCALSMKTRWSGRRCRCWRRSRYGPFAQSGKSSRASPAASGRR
jgi:ABC-type uncharacterized transport system ATPase subunit